MTGIRDGIDPYSQAFTTRRNRLGRALWAVTWLLLCRFSPRPMHAWRALVLRCFGAKLGRKVHVYPGAVIWAPWNLEMGDHACLASDVNCYSMARVVIGARAIVSQGAHLCTGTHDYASDNFQLYALPIIIEENAWICAEAFIGPGVVVHQGAVIGARSVVTRSMPAGMVCAGSPCRPIKRRWEF